MSTSLAEQLRRLAAPQTSLLIDSRKRASILFDLKEAANKDREEIYEIGHAGLMELIALNPSFLHFEQTLFDPTAKHLERSVESPELNKTLNKTIKKFFCYLSPYFQLKPAHCCLEWLIRRFHIHQFNKDDFLALILPYHETMIFVKCIQVLDLRDSKDKWAWLQPIQKPGVRLAKSVVITRASSSPEFLQFVCKSTVDAIKELDVKASMLRTQIAFYCTVVIGAVEYASAVNESHVTNILPSLLKGLSSKVLDFCAASIMITAQLVHKTQLSTKLLHGLINKICHVPHSGMQQDLLMILILICRRQTNTLPSLPDDAVTMLAENEGFINSIQALTMENIDVSSFCVFLVSSCLRRIQEKGNVWTACQKCLEVLLAEVHFKSEEASQVIQVSLDSYKPLEKKRTKSSDVIEIESDDEDGLGVEQDIQLWYSKFLQTLERQYPSEFDAIIKQIMQGGDESTESRRRALKIILAFRLKSSYTDDKVSIYENLYHYSSTNRLEAVKFIVKNAQSLQASPHNEKLLKEAITDRLSDDSPKIVCEILKLPTEYCLKILDGPIFVEKLQGILSKAKANRRASWVKPMEMALQHFTKAPVYKNFDSNRLLLTLLPFMFPASKDDLAAAKIILSSNFASKYSLFEEFSKIFNTSKDLSGISQKVENVLKSGEGLPKISNFLDSINTVSSSYFENSLNFAFFLKISQFCCHNDDNVVDSLRLFEFIDKNLPAFEMIPSNSDEEWFISAQDGKIQVKLILGILETIAKQIKTENGYDFDTNSASTKLVLKILEILITQSFSGVGGLKEEYTESLKRVLDCLFPTVTDKLNFFANFYIVDRIPQLNLSPEFQIRGIRVFNIFAGKKDVKYEVNTLTFVKIIIGLRSSLAVVRECALEGLRVLRQSNELSKNYENFAQKLLARQEEIALDSEQIGLIVFITLTGKKDGNLSRLLSDFIDVILSNSTSNCIKAELLKILRHMNDVSTFEKLLQVGMDILDHVEKNISEKDFILDPSRVEVFDHIISRFDESTIKIAKNGSMGWKLIERSMKLYDFYLLKDNRPISIASLVMDVFEEGVYEKLSNDLKQKFITLAIEASTCAMDISVSTSAKKLMRRITFDAKHIGKILNEMSECCYQESSRKRASAPICLNSSKWKNGITLLEFLQNKKKLANFHEIIPPLFEILKSCLHYEEQSSLEYPKQLILSCLLLCCQKLEADGGGRKSAQQLDKVFHIDLVVQCIRATQNPQTHHHALLLLSHCATIMPNQVLQNIMGIFTFMGSSVLRHDDDFSFQLISNIIESVIPVLINSTTVNQNKQTEAVVPVLKIFSDILLDVPEHRRLPLYTKLLRTLDASKYLWMFLCVLFESHIFHDEKEKVKHSTKRYPGLQEDFPKRIEIALQITKDFDPPTVLHTCISLFEYILNLPMDKPDENDAMEVDSPKTDANLFSIEGHSAKQLRHYKYVIIQFINSLTSSTQFVNQIAMLSDDETKAIKSLYQNFIIIVLMYIPEVTSAVEKNTETNQLKYWKVMLHYCYDVLDNAISLLSPDMFLIVVQGLMQHKILTVRKKVIELLIAKLQHKSEFFVECSEENFLKLLQPLNTILDHILDPNCQSNENILLQQIALNAIKLLSKILAYKHPVEFKNLVIKLTNYLKEREAIPKILIATIVLSLTEICSNLKAQSISVLSRFMPHLIEVLNDQVEILSDQPPDNINIAVITGMQKIFESLPLFLSIYLSDILVAICSIRARVELQKDQQDQRATVAATKLASIWTKIATVIPLRVLIPVFDQTYKRQLEAHQLNEIGFLMKLIIETFEHVNGGDIQSLQVDLTNFFLQTLEFRSLISESENDSSVTITEQHIIRAFVALVLKLSESSFRPLYHKVYDWAIRDSTSKDRTITYFLLSSKVAEALKSLFVLFASDFIQNAAELLDKCNPSKSEQLFLDTDDKNCLLIENILKTLTFVFLHDSKGFVNAHRFDILMQPIVDQLENTTLLENDNLRDVLIACIAQLAVAVSNDTLWKQLNYQVLLKTRSNSSEIRILAFNCCVEIARKLGEDFSPLLPETIPFVAELMEDENPKVEKSCQNGIREMEKILGESLQKYF